LRAEWHVVTLVCYLNVSGTDVANPVVVMAGHIATVAEWQAFEEEALAILREFGVTYFRGRDMQNDNGEYVRWSVGRKRELIRRVNKALARRVGLAISIATLKTSFRGLQAGRPRDQSPVGFCFAGLLDLLLKDGGVVSAMKVPGVDLSFVMEEGNGNWEIQRCLRLRKTWLRLERKTKGEPQFLGDIAFVARQSSIAIQMADLFAFLIRRHAITMRRKSGLPVKMHPYLALLLKDIRHIGSTASDFGAQAFSTAAIFPNALSSATGVSSHPIFRAVD
jgi:hypothetical protein